MLSYLAKKEKEHFANQNKKSPSKQLLIKSQNMAVIEAKLNLAMLKSIFPNEKDEIEEDSEEQKT